MEYFKKNWFVILYVVTLFIVSVFPGMFKESFVERTGNIELIGPFMGALLAISILFKWKYANAFFYIIFTIAIAMDLFSILSYEEKYIFNRILLFFCHAGLVVIFKYSKQTRDYLNFTVLPNIEHKVQ